MTSRRRRTRDRGFTLIELLLAITIMGIITVPLSDAVISYFRNTDQTTARLNESHDAQITAAYWARDVASIGTRDTAPPYALKQSVEVGSAIAAPPNQWPYQCGTGGTVIVRLAWDDFDTSGVNTFTEVSYQIKTATTELHRIRCNGSATPVSDTVMAHDLDPSQPPVPTCTPTPCSIPTAVTLTLHIKDPKDRNSAAYDVPLNGQRRQT